MEDWTLGPPVLVGERVLWMKNDRKGRDSGVVRWIGKLSNESKDWTVGIELDKPLPCDGTDGSWGDRKLFHCNSRRGVFLPLHRIQKEVSNIRLKPTECENLEAKLKNLGSSMGRTDKYENRGNRPSRKENKAERTLKELPEWMNSVNGERERNLSSDSDDPKSDFQSSRKLVRRQKKRSKSPKVVVRKEEYYSSLRRSDIRRPFSITGRIIENNGESRDKWQKKYESCALEEKYIREFIQREISKHQSLVKSAGTDKNMNDVKGNFKKIDEDDIHTFANGNLDGFQGKPPKKFDSRASRRSDVFHPREKSNGFFSFLKWFKKSKEMPELERMKDSSVTSSPLFIRRRSSSCGSVDTLFSIATVNSFAFVSPVQYQAVISSSHTTYPVPVSVQISDDEAKSKNRIDYENNLNKIIQEVKVERFCTEERKKKCKAPDPPRDISLPNTLEHKKSNEDDGSDGKTGHRRTVSESFKDKKAGYYCHVQGKRKAPLPPPSAPLYPSLGSLKSQCPSMNKKKRPAPPPPEVKDKCTKAKVEDLNRENEAKTANYDNLPFPPMKNDCLVPKEPPKTDTANVSPLLGLKNDISSSPLPSRPWYKRSSSGNNITKKESVKLSDKKRNKENEEWMPEVGFSRRPVSNEGGHNIFNLLARLDRNQDKRKEEKRKSQISILANISELDREAAEIVRKEHAQEKKMIADKDEKYYTSLNVLSSFPTADADKQSSKVLDKNESTEHKVTKSPFDEFKLKPEVGKPKDLVQTSPKTPELSPEKPKDKVEYDASAELDYYINPWNCPKCTLENPGWEKFCEACNTMRVKFRSVKENGNKGMQKPKQEAKVVEAQPKPASPIHEKPGKEEAKTETDNPSEDNVEEVRRKRLEFFLSKQNSSRDSTVTEDEDEKVKLKLMVKEMKNSLPKRETGVINNAPNEEQVIEVDSQVKAAPVGGNLHSKEGTSGDADSKAKEFSNVKVQQTWQPNANDPNKRGAAVKKRSESAPSNTAEAIIVTKTTVLEDVRVKKGDKTQKVSSSAQTKSFVKSEDPKKNDILESHIYTNIQDIKEKPGILDLSTPENTFTNGDIEAITAKLQREGAGLPDYKVDIQSTEDTNTLDVNRLLKKLEAAINTGEHVEAANIAKELARMKVSCSVMRQNAGPEGASKIIVDLYIEDKVTHKGPIQIRLLPSITLAELKMKVEREWNIPRNVQRWILGKQLAMDDNKTLEEHGVVENSAPVFLYIVTPEQDSEKKEDCLKNTGEPVKIDRRNGKVLNTEARRPSLIIEEEGENISEEESNEKTAESLKLITSGSKRRESFQKQDSFEKPQVNEMLRRELKNLTSNLVKDRIKWLSRAVHGETREEARRVEIQGRGEIQGRREIWSRGEIWGKREIWGRERIQDKQESTEDDAGNTGNARNAGKAGHAENVEQQEEEELGAAALVVGHHYDELVQLERSDLVLNIESFECPICFVNYGPREGVVLKDCLHTFCRPCLISAVQYNEEAQVKCPYRDDDYSCDSVIQEREIKSLVPEGVYEQHLAKSIALAENTIGNTYHCQTPDCHGWCVVEDNVNEFRCPVCDRVNCISCHAIHSGMTCQEYMETLDVPTEANAEGRRTREMLQEMVDKGDAMACPTCQVVLMKKWGCDWLRCSLCKTEICWVTRGPRWGPGGKGDDSAGCRCGVNGVKCHPNCSYCH